MSSPGTLASLDIAPFLNPDSENRVSTAAAIHSACLEYGFFYLNIEAFVDPSVPEELAQLGRQFFSLPQEKKDDLSLKNQDFARGERHRCIGAACLLLLVS
jgi:isopenicillin N synthase-like dioxygenase